MKKTACILLVMLVISGLFAMAQINPIKPPRKPKTEQPSKPSSKNNNASKNNGLSTSSKSRAVPAVVQRLMDDMIWVEGGTFNMGEGNDFGSFSMPHQVTLSGYYICRYEVTQGLWRAVMGTNIRQQRDRVDASSLFGEGENYPMYFVSWDDCQVFLRKLNQLTGKRFRLPTEAEWEYAARGGNRSHNYRYAGSNDVDKVAWHKGNSGKTSHPVGTKLPNELGLYDMSGNMWEWCQDWFDKYNGGAQINPTGPQKGTFRTMRGGSWLDDAIDSRVFNRIGSFQTPQLFFGGEGMRVTASSL